MLRDVNGPNVCVCVPTYNAEHTIRETLTSLLSQTYHHFTINIVDNASTDNTLQVVRSFGDPRVMIHEHAENIGGEGNFNRCIALCSGDYTAIYHADDVYEPDILQKQVDYLVTHPDVGAVLTEATLIDEDSDVIGAIKVPAVIKTEDDIYSFEQIFKAVLRHSNFLICPSAMVRTAIYKNTVATWRGDLFASSADLDIWFRIALTHRIAILPLPLINNRISTRQFSERVKRSTARADFFLVMDFYLKQPVVKNFITKHDLKSYEDLERRNQVMRATNLFIAGDISEAKTMCEGVYSWEMLLAAIKNKRGKLTLFLSGLLWFFLLFKMELTGKRVLSNVLKQLGK